MKIGRQFNMLSNLGSTENSVTLRFNFIYKLLINLTV